MEVCEVRKLRALDEHLSTARRCQAEHSGHVWSWDFVEDQTLHGSRLRILTILAEYSRRWLGFYPAHSIRAVDVFAALERTLRVHGTPGHIRSDNGPEFIAHVVQDGLKERVERLTGPSQDVTRSRGQANGIPVQFGRAFDPPLERTKA